MEGRRRETSAFSRSRASCGNELRRGCSHVALSPPFARDTHRPNHVRHSTSFPPQTLATLNVSRRPGYGGVVTAQSVATPAHYHLSSWVGTDHRHIGSAFRVGPCDIQDGMLATPPSWQCLPQWPFSLTHDLRLPSSVNVSNRLVCGTGMRVAA